MRVRRIFLRETRHTFCCLGNSERRRVCTEEVRAWSVLEQECSTDDGGGGGGGGGDEGGNLKPNGWTSPSLLNIYCCCVSCKYASVDMRFALHHTLPNDARLVFSGTQTSDTIRHRRFECVELKTAVAVLVHSV